jgi:MATE family multidrug resistance protein
MVSMGVVDTLLVGPLGPKAMSALALGNTIYFGLLITGIGLMMGLDAHVSRAYGAGDLRAARRGLTQAMWLAVLYTPVLFAAMTAVPSLMLAAGYDPDLTAGMKEYLFPMRWGILPALWFVAHRSFMSAVDVTRPLLLSAALGNIVNFLLDVWLLDGGWGIEAQGVVGVAWSTSFCRLVLLAPLWIIVRHTARFARFPTPSRAPDWALIRTLISVGAPVGLQYGAEVMTFGAAALMMGALGEGPLAAHQVAINVVSTLFMVPLGLGSAASVRTGQALGAGDLDGVRRAGWTAISVSLAYSLAAASMLALIPALIASAYRLPLEVQLLAVELLTIAAFFQVGDSLQATVTGVLRGLGDTRVPFLVVLAANGLVALPLGYVMGVWLQQDPHWIWYGLGLGLCLVAVALIVRFARLIRRMTGSAVP